MIQSNGVIPNPAIRKQREFSRNFLLSEQVRFGNYNLSTVNVYSICNLYNVVKMFIDFLQLHSFKLTLSQIRGKIASCVSASISLHSDFPSIPYVPNFFQQALDPDQPCRHVFWARKLHVSRQRRDDEHYVPCNRLQEVLHVPSIENGWKIYLWTEKKWWIKKWSSLQWHVGWHFSYENEYDRYSTWPNDQANASQCLDSKEVESSTMNQSRINVKAFQRIISSKNANGYHSPSSSESVNACSPNSIVNFQVNQ